MNGQQKPENFRAYGLLMRQDQVLIAAEHVGEVFCWKFPGGRVEDEECAEEALIREYLEEASLEIRIERMLHTPGTLLSPWTGRNYSPIYFQVSGGGDINVPAHEPLELSFKEPAQALDSSLMAEPEKVALRLLLNSGS